LRGEELELPQVDYLETKQPLFVIPYAFILSEHFKGDFPMRAMTPLVATTFVDLASGAFALALLLSGGASLAQTTGTVNPSGAPAEPSVKEDIPTGGCMPIGLTASGEIVFPIQCRELIEQQRGKAVEQKPAGVEEKPVGVEEKPVGFEEKRVSVEEKPVTMDVAPKNSQPAIKPVKTVSLPKRVEHKPRERATASAQGQPAAQAPTNVPAIRWHWCPC
jgi:hypothetical protein